MQVFHTTMPSMNTRLDIVIPSINKNLGNEIKAEIKLLLTNLENKISFFSPTSELNFLNGKAASKPTKIGSELLELIKICKKYYFLTGGYFDAGLGKYKNYIDKIDENDYNSGIENVTITDNDEIKFEISDLKLDFGGIGKGYALDKISDILTKKYSVSNALISFGESSILAIGTHPYGKYWPIAINNPNQPNQPLRIFELSNQCLSVSGLHSENKPHIINPKSCEICTDKIISWAVSDNAVAAEAFTTAMISSYNSGKSMQQCDEISAFDIILLDKE